MTRISYRRATPENWERTIKRMVSLNHVTLSPEDARAILRYLADHQGLAPEELRPIAFEAERRMINYTYKADETTANLEELHKGVSKAYPCGAGLGLLGVATDGDVALCHRFAGSDAHKLGTVRDGIDRDPSRRQQDRLQRLLGASPLLRWLLSRGAHPLRRHDPRESPLLRMDPRVDRRVPARLRRAFGQKPGVPGSIR